MSTGDTFTLGEFAQATHKSTSTLQRWDREGVLKAHRTVTNRRYYTQDQYEQVMGLEPESEQEHKRTVIYARVSSRNQQDDLASQVEFLRTWANAKGMIVDTVYTDIGSGLNYKRKHFNELMFDDDVDTIIIAHKDRLTRFGFDWFNEYLHRRGVNLIVVNNEQVSPQAELVEDLLTIIHMFSQRVTGLRKYGKLVKDDASLPH